MTTFDILRSGLIVQVNLLTEVPDSTDPATWRFLQTPGYRQQQALVVVLSVLPDQVAGILTASFEGTGNFGDKVACCGVTYQSQYLFFAPAQLANEPEGTLHVSVSFIAQKWTAP
jgi:hypothetical protein